jgi:DNA-entry nuclease
MMRKKDYAFVLTAVLCLLAGCVTEPAAVSTASPAVTGEAVHTAETVSTPSSSADETASAEETAFSLAEVPGYSGSAYAVMNDNHPYFDDSSLTAESYEAYSVLDALGRCGKAEACIGEDLMPTEPRGSIGMIKPSGWHTVRYDDLIEDKYLYNRCHLIGYQLTGEGANEQNLITGTRYMNVEGMEPFENETADYIQSTHNHVQYEVTPIFEGDNLVASGVLMEAESVEDHGEGLMFCVYCYNVQPGITINYADGSSERASTATAEASQQAEETTYIVNTNTGKFHLPDCPSVQDMKEKNKMVYTGDRQDLIDQGYQPCQNCNP